MSSKNSQVRVTCKSVKNACQGRRSHKRINKSVSQQCCTIVSSPCVPPECQISVSCQCVPQLCQGVWPFFPNIRVSIRVREIHLVSLQPKIVQNDSKWLDLLGQLPKLFRCKWWSWVSRRGVLFRVAARQQFLKKLDLFYQQHISAHLTI